MTKYPSNQLPLNPTLHAATTKALEEYETARKHLESGWVCDGRGDIPSAVRRFRAAEAALDTALEASDAYYGIVRDRE